MKKYSGTVTTLRQAIHSNAVMLKICKMCEQGKSAQSSKGKGCACAVDEQTALEHSNLPIPLA